jgi:integrase
LILLGITTVVPPNVQISVVIAAQLRKACISQVKVTTIVHNYTAELRELFALAKVDMTPRGFRHYFITQRLAQGWSADEVSTMVGTSPQEIRKTYAASSVLT